VAIALLVLISATAYFINLYRDSIALEVARSALGESDVRVVDVSVESISSNEVRFDEITLELAAGGIISIDGVTLPVRFRGLTDSTLHIDTVRFEPGAADTGPIRFAAGLQSFLQAPAATPGATIRIDEVLLPDMPLIRDVAWHADLLNPTLRATVGTFELITTTTEDDDGAFRGSLRALLPDDTEAVMLGFRLAPDQEGFLVRGTINLALEPLLPALHAIGAVPAEVTGLISTLSGVFEFRLEADETLPVEVQATFDTASGIRYGGDLPGGRCRNRAVGRRDDPGGCRGRIPVARLVRADRAVFRRDYWHGLRPSCRASSKQRVPLRHLLPHGSRLFIRRCGNQRPDYRRGNGKRRGRAVRQS
jgi:hypothetical protein